MQHTQSHPITRVLVTGGAGYVGAVLVPKLLSAGYHVCVLDLFIYGDHVLDGVRDNPALHIVRGDIRDKDLIRDALQGCQAVIHLACISNDPSFELNPELGKSINFDAFRPLVELARQEGVRRFVFASSSSVYGVKQEPEVTEDLPLEPLTDYSRYKAMCEDVLREFQSERFTTVVLRPATLCGYSPRMRLDLTVNLLVNHAINHSRIRVFGGSQYRPNLHVDDMASLYVRLLELPDSAISGRTWNVGYENRTVLEIATSIQELMPGDVTVAVEPTEDLRSYRISSRRIERDINFQPMRSVRAAAQELIQAFRRGEFPDGPSHDRYYNVRRMQSIGLS